MGDGVRLADRIVLPVGEDVDRHEIHRRGELRRLEPELPHIGIGDGKVRAPSDLFDVGFDFAGRQLAPQQRLVADDQSLDRAGMTMRELEGRLDLEAILRTIAPKPNPLHHFKPVFPRKRGDSSLGAHGGIGSDAGGQGGKALQVLLDLPVRDAEIRSKGGLLAVERGI